VLTATFHSHSWVFKNEYRYNSYLKMSVKRPLSCSWVLCFCGQVLYRVLCFCGQVLYRVLCFCGQVLYRVLCFCGQVIYRVLCFCGQVLYRVLCFCGQVLYLCICHLVYRENFMSKIWDNWEERMLQIPSILWSKRVSCPLEERANQRWLFAEYAQSGSFNFYGFVYN
jgi:hypothetical protein